MALLGTLIVGGLIYGGAQTYSCYRRQAKPSLGMILAAPQSAVSATSAAQTLSHAQPVAPASGLWAKLTTLKRPALLQDTRREQLTALTGEDPGLSLQEQKETHYFQVSLVTLGITSVATIFHSPLIVLSVPLLGYIYLSIVVHVYTAFQTKQYRLLRSFEAIIVGGELLAGFFFVSSLAGTLYYVAERALVKAEAQSRKGMIDVFGQQPRSVWVVVAGVECELPFEAVQIGDLITVNAGETIPVDGCIIEGRAAIDEHLLTGEARPVEKTSGDAVLAPTLVLSGKIVLRVERAGNETTAAQIGQILNQTAEFKQTIEAHGVALVERFIPLTLAMGLLSLPFMGANRALALLESSFGYNLRFSGPMSMLNLIQIAAKRGMLIKDGSAMERLHRIDTVIFDKTGTLTLEQPHVGAIHTYQDLDETTLLTWAAAAEYRQSHPIARAILQAARERGLVLPQIDDAHYRVGYGIEVGLNERVIRVGSDRFMALEHVALPEAVRQVQATCHDQGYSLVLVALDQHLVGAIELHPTLRPEAAGVVRQLQQRNLKLYIISGDHEQPTRQLAQSLGIAHYVAGVLPQAKSALVQQIQREGRVVCFVGDGINDSIALKQADLSVSLRGASTAATDTAQVVLMAGNLRHLPALLDLGAEFKLNMRNNLLLATVPSVICIGGVYLLKWGLVTAVMLYNVSLVGSLGNAFLPLLLYQLKEEAQQERVALSVLTPHDQEA